MLDFYITERPGMVIVGIECRTSNAPDEAFFDIPKHWKRFWDENILDKIICKASDDVIALFCEYDGDYSYPYTYVIGCAVTSLNEVPNGMVVKRIPKGTYAVFNVEASHTYDLIQAQRDIWETPLPRIYGSDYEVHGKMFSSGSPSEVEVFISVEDEALEVWSYRKVDVTPARKNFWQKICGPFFS